MSQENKIKKIKFGVEGMHCKSCKMIIESELKEMDFIKDPKIDLEEETGYLKINTEKKDLKEAKKEIKEKIKELGYRVKKLKKKSKPLILKTSKKKNNLLTAGIILIAFGLLYFVIQKSGSLALLAKLNEGSVSLFLIFIIGILTSFHCIGMCGGLVVTYTTKCNLNKTKLKSDSKKNSLFTPHIEYNLARLLSYALVGAILGGIGSFFAISAQFSGIITLISGVFMILMGLSFLTKWKILKKVSIPGSKTIVKSINKLKNSGGKKSRTPMVIGFLNGFMPCGPLQIMQIYALSTGSFLKGGLAMAVFALGTIPLMFGFGSFLSYFSQDRIKQVLKFSGVVVIILGLFVINRGLINFGYDPLYAFKEKVLAKEQLTQKVASNDEKNKFNKVSELNENEEIQVREMKVTFQGYQPNVIYIKKGIPVKWVIIGEGVSRCTDEIILHGGYDISRKIKGGEEVVIEFTPEEAGEIPFSCWMKMVWGKFIVT
jgi:sulfite exporter TauE/SafE/copper chaperone CopZ